MRLVSCIFALCALTACGGDKPKPNAEESPKAEAETKVAEAPTGSIEGVVVLAEGETQPLLEDPKKTAKLVVTTPPAPCTPMADDDLQPVKLDATTRALSAIHVALTGMASTAPATPRTHELRLENCRLTPRVLGARVGDSVRITNASEPPLLPSMLGDSFMEAIMANKSRTIELKRPGASRISCNFGSYCGQTDVLTTTHSLFAVTDASGRFRIDNVPLDRPLTLHGWHPLFDEATETVTLTKDAPTRTVRLVLKPQKVAVAPAPVAPAKAEPTKKQGKPDTVYVQ